jgi:hypothetical protein
MADGYIFKSCYLISCAFKSAKSLQLGFSTAFTMTLEFTGSLI